RFRRRPSWRCCSRTSSRESGIGNRQRLSCKVTRSVLPIPHSRFPIPGSEGAKMRWFEIALVVLTLLSGLIWLLDKLVLARRRAAHAGLLDDGRDPWYVDYAKAFFPVLAVVLVLRSFVAEPFRIPSNSMMPTLLTGDFILVNKFAYGLRLPITNTKIVPVGEPQRGDVVVFKPPRHPEQDWIKRVIGLPGDTIEYKDNQVFVNGKPFGYARIGDYVGVGSGAEMTGASLLE